MEITDDAGASVRKVAYFAVVGMLLVNFALSLWRSDTMPSLAGYDEAIINDGAVGFARFGSLRFPSLEGTPIDVQYPPGYLVLQGLIFRTFGLTPLTFRLSSKIGHMVVCVLGLLILRRLWQRRVLSGTSSMVVAVLWLSDVAGYWIGRQARMEPIEEALALAAALLLLTRPNDRRIWLGAAALVGLAFSMHTSAVIFWLPFVLGLVMWRSRLGWPTIIVCAALPVAILAAFWFAAHQHPLAALTLLRELHSYRNDRGLNFDFWESIITKRSWLGAIQLGGPSYWLVLISWFLLAVRFRGARGNPWIAFCVGSALLQALCLEYLTGIYAQRIVLYFPLALLAIGIALTNQRLRFQVAALVVAGLLGAGQFAAMSWYAMASGDRSPSRFDHLPLPSTIRTVASTTELWYYFVSNNRPFRIITLENPRYAEYWVKRPEHLDDFDAVILPRDNAMLMWPELARRHKLYFADFTGILVICLKDTS